MTQATCVSSVLFAAVIPVGGVCCDRTQRHWWCVAIEHNAIDSALPQNTTPWLVCVAMEYDGPVDLLLLFFLEDAKMAGDQSTPHPHQIFVDDASQQAPGW